MWPGLFARHGGRLSYDFDLSTLAHLSEGYAGGEGGGMRKEVVVCVGARFSGHAITQ
jgi:hypothetical protein